MGAGAPGPWTIASMLSKSVLDALVATDFARKYYDLCALHPHREASRCGCPHPQVLATLNDLGIVAKERGPGRMYRIRTPHPDDRLEFSFVIKGSGTYIEPALSTNEGGQVCGDNYAVLAFSARVHAGQDPATPPYPRPSFFSLVELRQIVGGCLELAQAVDQRLRQ